MSDAEKPNGNPSSPANGTNGQGNENADAFDFGIGGTQPRRTQPSRQSPPAPEPTVAPQSSPPPRPRSRKAGAASYEPPYEDPQRKPKTERKDAFNATAWLIEGVSGMLDEIQHNDLGLPQDFWVHAYAARKEGLLAARALIDHAIQRSDEELAKAAQKEEKRTRRGGVDIDFGA